MGFSESLWNQFDIVKQNCNTGEKRIKAVQQLLKKSYKEELSYSETLAKASQALSVCGGKSLCASVELLKTKIDDEKSSRSHFATQLDGEVQKLNSYSKIYLKTSNQLAQKTSKDQSHYDSKCAHLEKTKNHYYSCCRNEEQLQEALSNPGLDPKKQESLNKDLEKAKQNKIQANDQYSRTVSEHESVHQEYIVACRDTLSQYEELEKALCTTLESALNAYASQRTEIATYLTSYSSAISDSTKTIDVAGDLASFVDQNSRNLQPNPAPVYEEWESGASKGRRKTKSFKIGFGGKKKEKKGSDDPLSPRASSRDSRRSSGGASSSADTMPASNAPPAPPPPSSKSEPAVSSPPSPAAGRAAAPTPASRADGPAAPAPPGRQDGPPAPAPPGRGDGPPTPNRGAGPPPPSRGDGPPPPSRGDGPPPPSQGDGPPPPSRGAGPPTPGQGAGGPPPAPSRAEEPVSADWKLAVALYANPGEGEGELYLEEGTYVFVINEDESGWWLGVTGSSVGFFPGSYIQYLEDEEQIGHVKAKALQDFVGDVDGDLSLTTGETVTIQSYNDQWFTGAKKNGEIGIFPCQYVTVLMDD